MSQSGKKVSSAHCSDFYHIQDNLLWLQNRATASPRAFSMRLSPLSPIPYVLTFFFFFASLSIMREFWWPPSKCFLFSLINPGPHGTRVQASDVFNSCAHWQEETQARHRVCVFLIWMYHSWHIHQDAGGEPQEAAAPRWRALLLGRSGALLINTVNTCKLLESQNTSRPRKMSPPN